MMRPERGNRNAAPDEFGDLRLSRRAILRGGFGVAGIGLAPAAIVGTTSGLAQTMPGSSVAVFPRHGSRTASPGTEITFRGLSVEALGAVTVVASRSGGHSGILVPHTDGQGASYVPDAPFLPGENVIVQAVQPLNLTAEGAVTFAVATPGAPPEIEANRETDNPATAPQSFRTRPDLRPPVIDVTTSEAGASPGLVFVGVKTQDGQNGAMIVDNEGGLVWFSPMPVDIVSINDVRVQEYQGQPVITWWEGADSRGMGLGHFVIRDGSYREIAAVQVGNGYAGADLHDFILTPRGTALIIIYSTIRWGLSQIGGPLIGTVRDSVVQEIEVDSGRVVFEWHSLDHIGLDESYIDPPSNSTEAWDYVHVNGIEVDDEGDLIVTARNSHAVYKIDRFTGDLIWRLNGKQSDYAMGENAETAFHHDARLQATGNLTLFDNAASDEDSDEVSRGVELSLDTESMTATLVREYIHPTGILSVSQGNMQVLPNGNVFIGWGSAPVFSEFSPDGTLLLNGRFPQMVNSYRAYRFPWVGSPTGTPAIVVERRSSDSVTVFASWNGATEIANWRFFAGTVPDQLEPVELTPRSGFETRISMRSTALYFAAQAEDSAGQVLGVSPVVAISE